MITPFERFMGYTKADIRFSHSLAFLLQAKRLKRNHADACGQTVAVWDCPRCGPEWADHEAQMEAAEI